MIRMKLKENYIPMIRAVNDIGVGAFRENVTSQGSKTENPMQSVNFETTLKEAKQNYNLKAMSQKQSEKINTTTAINKNSTTSTVKKEYATTAKQLEDIFSRASKKYNLSIDLLKAVAKQESNFQITAVSKSGAQGIMQLMPATAKALGVTDSFDPEQNIMGGAKFLSQMLERYNGNITLALAAYNAGPGSVDKYNGVPPYEETQDYVVKVANYMNQTIDVSEQKDGTGLSSSQEKNKSAVTKYKITYEQWLEQIQQMGLDANTAKIQAMLNNRG